MTFCRLKRAWSESISLVHVGGPTPQICNLALAAAIADEID